MNSNTASMIVSVAALAALVGVIACLLMEMQTYAMF